MATTPPTAEQLNVRLYASHGDDPSARRSILDYTEASTVTGNFSAIVPVEIAGAATNTPVDLATYVDACTWVTIKDRGGTGFKVSLVNTGTKFQVAANGVFTFKNGIATPPLLYIDNVSATDTCFLDVGIMGARA